MTEIIINGLAVVGAVVVSAVSLVAAYFIIGVGLVLLDLFLHRLMHYIFHTFGGIADPDTSEFKPPRPPWDRIRYEIGRVKYGVQILQQKMGIGSMNKHAVKPNGLEALYEQREEYYE